MVQIVRHSRINITKPFATWMSQPSLQGWINGVLSGADAIWAGKFTFVSRCGYGKKLLIDVLYTTKDI